MSCTAAFDGILVVTGFWPTRNNAISGVFVREQVEGYRRSGLKVRVIAPQVIKGLPLRRPLYSASAGIEVWSPAYLNIPRIGWQNRFVHACNRWLCASVIKRNIRRVIGDQMCLGIHIHGLGLVGLSAPDWLDPMIGPAVLTVHGRDPSLTDARPPWLKREFGRLSDFLGKIALVGRPLLGYASSLGLEESKLVVVPNGTWLPQGSGELQVSARNSKRILSVSNLVALKGLDYNLRALREVVDMAPELEWEYRVVGDGPERAKLEKLAKELGLFGRVVFLGRLDRVATLREIADCDVFSLPSWAEAFGIVYLEAMARGRAVIGCSGQGAAEMMTDGLDGLLVEPKSVSDLAGALHRLLTDDELATSLGCRGRIRASQYCWSRNVESYISLFQTLRNELKEHSSSRSGPVWDASCSAAE